MKGEYVFQCTKKNIPIKDLEMPCRILTKELNFQHQLTKNEKKSEPTLDQIVEKTNAPVKLIFKVCEIKMFSLLDL